MSVRKHMKESVDGINNRRDTNNYYHIESIKSFITGFGIGALLIIIGVLIVVGLLSQNNNKKLNTSSKKGESKADVVNLASQIKEKNLDTKIKNLSKEDAAAIMEKFRKTFYEISNSNGENYKNIFEYINYDVAKEFVVHIDPCIIKKFKGINIISFTKEKNLFSLKIEEKVETLYLYVNTRDIYLRYYNINLQNINDKYLITKFVENESERKDLSHETINKLDLRKLQEEYKNSNIKKTIDILYQK